MQIFLVENIVGGGNTNTGGGVPSNSLINTDGGLIGAGAGINFQSVANVGLGVGQASIQSVNTDTAGNFPFGAGNAPINIGGGNNAEFNVAPGFGGVNVSYMSGTTNTVMLATLTITVGTGATTYTLSSIGTDGISGGGTPTTGNTISNTYDYDAGSAGLFTGASAFSPVYTFTVTPNVPEPSSMLLCGLAACGGIVTAVRRRGKAKNVDAKSVVPS